MNCFVERRMGILHNQMDYQADKVDFRGQDGTNARDPRIARCAIELDWIQFN
jgi:hypothetical protein